MTVPVGESTGSPLVTWWAGLSRAQRAVVAVLAFVVGFNVALVGLRSAVGGGNPGGPVSSSYSTGDGGLEAYADLARASGHPVVRLKEKPEPGSLPVDGTVVVADPRRLTEDDYRAVARFALGGGRLVLAGASTEVILQGATGEPIMWEETTPIDPLVLGESGIGAVRTLAGDRGGRWIGADGVETLLADPAGRPLVVTAPVGEGVVVALADPELLHNANLASEDNAALALELIGGSGRQVVFVESVHGFATSGIDALPPSWKWAVAGLALALLFGLWWAGSRFGPPEPHERRLRPARLDHVQAVAADVERVSKHPADLVGPLLEANRTRLADRLGVALDAAPAVWRSAAERSGTDPEVVEAGTTVPGDEAGALYVGALAAHHRQVDTEPGDPVLVPLSPRDPAGTVAGPEAL